MEKSKADPNFDNHDRYITELYMERLQKWRDERQKKQEENRKNTKKIQPTQTAKRNIRRETFDKKTTGAALPKPNLPKSSNQVVNKPKPLISKHFGMNKKSSLPVQTNGLIQKPTVTDYKKTNPGTVTIGPKSSSVKKVSSDGYLSRFEQWKKEKELTRSEKKIQQFKSNQNTAKSAEITVKAKSRLFDHCQHHGKTKSEKENNQLKTDHNKTNRKAEHTERNTTKTASGVKRRHSMASEGPPAKRKPVGILKRKSCIGSIDWDVQQHNSENMDSIAAKTENRQEDTRQSENIITFNPRTPSRNVRFMSPAESTQNSDGIKTIRKTPVKRQELQKWLNMTNRTPSKFRHLLCFEDHEKDPVQDLLIKSTLTVAELSEQANVLEIERLNTEALKKLDSMLDECMILFEAGCPVEAILPWLDDIFKKVPPARTSVKYYKCKVDVLKSTLDLDAILQIFEEATINDAQPKTELAKILTETVKFVTDEKLKQAKKSVRSKRRSDVQEENVFASSSIVYSVGNVTPFSDSRKKPTEASSKSDCKVVTPVRRSTRRSLQNLPDSLKDKRTVTSLDELDDKNNVLFQQNLALKEVLDKEDNDFKTSN